MREFTTAAKAAAAESKGEERTIVFKHDGRDVTFFYPDPGQMAAAMSVSMGGDTDPETQATAISFIFEVMDHSTQRYFRGRLLDRDDPFDMDSEGGLMDIWEALVEEWSARPTKSPSDYMPSQRAAGQKSTAKRRSRASTPSASPSTASAT